MQTFTPMHMQTISGYYGEFNTQLCTGFQEAAGYWWKAETRPGTASILGWCGATEVTGFEHTYSRKAMQLQGTEATKKKELVNYTANLPISWPYIKFLKHKIASAKRQRRLEFFHILLLFVLRIAALSRSKRHLPTSWSVLKLNTEKKKKDQSFKFWTWYATNATFCSIYFSSSVMFPGIATPFPSSGKQTFSWLQLPDSCIFCKTFPQES